jgi:amino-acid N-acetyltransferase
MISGLTAEDVAERTSKARNLTVRKAAMRDIGPMLELINGYAARGIMLPRTEFEMSENMRDFSVIYSGDELLGCGALHFYSPTMGEVRSLAVADRAKTLGIGRMVVETLVKEALDFELDAIFAFTYVPGFFAKVGFDEVERGELPLKAWKDCLRCPKFQSCDEIAVLRVLNPERWEISPAEPSPFEQGLLVQLPTVRRTDRDRQIQQ